MLMTFIACMIDKDGWYINSMYNCLYLLLQHFINTKAKKNVFFFNNNNCINNNYDLIKSH